MIPYGPIYQTISKTKKNAKKRKTSQNVKNKERCEDKDPKGGKQ
jgi:hypothetical protein